MITLSSEVQASLGYGVTPCLKNQEERREGTHLAQDLAEW